MVRRARMSISTEDVLAAVGVMNEKAQHAPAALMDDPQIGRVAVSCWKAGYQAAIWDFIAEIWPGLGGGVRP